jgi:hypothetical protein
MKYTLILAIAGATALTGCANRQEEIGMAPPPAPGALVGTIAADRDGDGIADGYYTADGQYVAFRAPPCPPPPPPPPPTPRGERG